MQKFRLPQTWTKLLVPLLCAGTSGMLLLGCGGVDPAPEPVGAGRVGPVEGYLLRPGDFLTVAFSGLPSGSQVQDHKERIKEDGTITLPLIGAINAEGKTTGQLQVEIHTNYVPKYYKQLTVTVKADELFFTVGGEVRRPDRYPYVNGITVVGAIHAAGGFSDFAKESQVQLRRVNGKPIIVNYPKAVKDRSLDPPVFPGDTVTVKKKILW